jgi:hypothetical protein
MVSDKRENLQCESRAVKNKNVKKVNTNGFKCSQFLSGNKCARFHYEFDDSKKYKQKDILEKV